MLDSTTYNLEIIVFIEISYWGKDIPVQSHDL